MTKLLLQLLSVQREKAKVVDVNGVAQGFVFVNTSGRPYSDHLWEIWNEARDKVKAPKVTMYQGTRHSRGTQLLEQGWDMAAVQDLLGHTRPDMTKRYAKWAATSKMGKMLEEADRGWEVESEEKASHSNDLRDFPVTTGT
jgi:site-specific recombinase XerD